MTITIPTTINAIIVITLISDNQNSSSPNNLALNKFIPTSTRIVNATVNQLGIAIPKFNVFSNGRYTIPEIIQVSQYVQPTIKPAIGPI